MPPPGCRLHTKAFGVIKAPSQPEMGQEIWAEMRNAEVSGGAIRAFARIHHTARGVRAAGEWRVSPHGCCLARPQFLQKEGGSLLLLLPAATNEPETFEAIVEAVRTTARCAVPVDRNHLILSSSHHSSSHPAASDAGSTSTQIWSYLGCTQKPARCAAVTRPTARLGDAALQGTPPSRLGPTSTVRAAARALTFHCLPTFYRRTPSRPCRRS